MKKDKEIKRVIFKSFEYLTEEDTFIRFSTLSKSETFLEKIKNIILKEMEEEEKKRNEEKEKKLKEEKPIENIGSEE